MNRFPGFDMHLRLNGIGIASQGSGLTVETPKGRGGGGGGGEEAWSLRGFCRNWQLIGTWTKRSLRSAH